MKNFEIHSSVNMDESLITWLASTGEPEFSECQTLPRVPKMGHSGKPIFPECCTRGRNALGEESLSRVSQNPWHSGKGGTRGNTRGNTRGRGALAKRNLHLTATLDGTICQIIEKSLPRVPCFSTRGRWPLPRVPCAGTRGRSLFPERLFLALGEGSLPRVSRESTQGNIFIFLVFCSIFYDALPHYLKLFAQVWLNFEFFRYILLFFSFSRIFWDTSNLNYRYMKSYNLTIQKMVFMTFDVYWGHIQLFTWNIEHFVIITWWTTCGKSVSKLQKNPNEVRKSRNLSGCRAITCKGCVQQLRRFRASCDVRWLKPKHLHMWLMW
jgi:hypothetical protein